MKIRQGFVSNSSSSSFVIAGELGLKLDTDSPDIMDDFIELDDYQSLEVRKYINNSLETWNTGNNDCSWGHKEEIEIHEKLYLTPFISDGNEIHWTLLKNPKVYLYQDGNHGVPYDYDIYDNIGEDSEVYILKEHNK